MGKVINAKKNIWNHFKMKIVGWEMTMKGSTTSTKHEAWAVWNPVYNYIFNYIIIFLNILFFRILTHVPQSLGSEYGKICLIYQKLKENCVEGNSKHRESLIDGAIQSAKENFTKAIFISKSIVWMNKILANCQNNIINFIPQNREAIKIFMKDIVLDCSR